MTRPERIISGGQTGADQGGLFAARDLGIPTGGTAPKGWRTEAGPAPWLADYGLVESLASDYPGRTWRNINDSDATVIFGDPTSAGSALTVRLCEQSLKPYLLNESAVLLRLWCEDNDIRVLNVAGNRESANPGIGERVRAVILEAFGPAGYIQDESLAGGMP